MTVVVVGGGAGGGGGGGGGGRHGSDWPLPILLCRLYSRALPSLPVANIEKHIHSIKTGRCRRLGACSCVEALQRCGGSPVGVSYTTNEAYSTRTCVLFRNQACLRNQAILRPLGGIPRADAKGSYLVWHATRQEPMETAPRSTTKLATSS